MSRILRAAILCIASLLVTVAVPFAAAEKIQNPPPAPIPAQIFTARRVFISNLGSTVITDPVNLPYDDFYASMKTWNQYELLSSPVDADLVLELSSSGSPLLPFPDELHLVIRETKTGSVLWAFVEYAKPATLFGSRRKNFETAMAALLGDMKTLVTPLSPAAAAAPKN
jgi:hypothetical protein